MTARLPLENMSLEDKIQAMESIWDDLRIHAATAMSPPWHGEVLATRETALDHGRDKFEDWSAASI